MVRGWYGGGVTYFESAAGRPTLFFELPGAFLLFRYDQYQPTLLLLALRATSIG